MAGMKSMSRIALWFGALIAAILAVWAALAIFNIWFLVPLDPALTQGQAIRIRLEYTVLFAVAFFLFAGLSRMAFKKVRFQT
jgi:hypothetical protein